MLRGTWILYFISRNVTFSCNLTGNQTLAFPSWLCSLLLPHFSNSHFLIICISQASFLVFVHSCIYHAYFSKNWWSTSYLMEIAFNNLSFGVYKYPKATVKNCNIEVSFTVMIQSGKFTFRFTILKWFHSDPTVILHFHFTNFTEYHCNTCKMASNQLQPGNNPQCPRRLMPAHRFELF